MPSKIKLKNVYRVFCYVKGIKLNLNIRSRTSVKYEIEATNSQIFQY